MPDDTWLTRVDPLKEDPIGTGLWYRAFGSPIDRGWTSDEEGAHLWGHNMPYYAREV